jgi:hypothetical protein
MHISLVSLPFSFRWSPQAMVGALLGATALQRPPLAFGGLGVLPPPPQPPMMEELVSKHVSMLSQSMAWYIFSRWSSLSATNCM